MRQATQTTPRPIPSEDTRGYLLRSLPEALRSSRLLQKELTAEAMTGGVLVTQGIVIRLLNDALAFEVLGILRYKRQCFMSRTSARRVKRTLLQYVSEARAQADWLAQRIVQIGGQAGLFLEQLLS